VVLVVALDELADAPDCFWREQCGMRHSQQELDVEVARAHYCVNREVSDGADSGVRVRKHNPAPDRQVYAVPLQPLVQMIGWLVDLVGWRPTSLVDHECLRAHGMPIAPTELTPPFISVDCHLGVERLHLDAGDATRPDQYDVDLALEVEVGSAARLRVQSAPLLLLQPNNACLPLLR
jgi:hypothetical protein